MTRKPTAQVRDLVAAMGGDKRAALEALRDRLTAELDRCKGQSLAAVSRELRAIHEELDAGRPELEALRDRLAAELTRARGQGAAAVARELRSVVADLDAMPEGRESRLDQLADRRAARRANATGGAVAQLPDHRGG